MSSPDDFETAPAEYVDALDPSMVVVDSGSAAVTAPSDSAAEVKANQNEENRQPQSFLQHPTSST